MTIDSYKRIIWSEIPLCQRRALLVTTNWGLPRQIHQDSVTKLNRPENVCDWPRARIVSGGRSVDSGLVNNGPWSGREKSQRLTLNSDNIFALHAECRHKGPGRTWTAGRTDGPTEATHKATDNRMGPTLHIQTPPDPGSWSLDPDYLLHPAMLTSRAKTSARRGEFGGDDGGNRAKVPKQ